MTNSEIDPILSKALSAIKKRWFVTGAAGFIGSHLVESLLAHGQTVVGFDNYATGHKKNVARFEGTKDFTMVEGDIRDQSALSQAISGCDLVLHQAALGSVPRSIEDPITSNAVNVEGTIRVFMAAKKATIGRVVYASSSSVYGDSQALPKEEDVLGSPLSPYAVSKRTTELYASVFQSTYGLTLTGLRYFNVFGPRQDPAGPYAAVIPRWIESMLLGKQTTLHGDGTTTRDFCYVSNVVRANILCALASTERLKSPAYNIGCGATTDLSHLHKLLADHVGLLTGKDVVAPLVTPVRSGDVKASLASISKASTDFGYSPMVQVSEGIERTVRWYFQASTSAN